MSDLFVILVERGERESMPEGRAESHLKKADIRNEIKVLIGGARVSQEWADEIEADGYAENAIGAANLARRLI